MQQITFNEWYERLKSPHYASNEKMNLAYQNCNIPLRMPFSSFKHRPEEIKEKYNYKFTPQI